jgi:hypothetical protein
MFSGFERAARQIEVACVRGCDNDQIHRRVGEQRIDILHHTGIGVSLLGEVPATLDDMRQAQIWVRVNKRSMKNLSCHSEPDQAYIERIAHARHCKRRLKRCEVSVPRKL